MVTEVMANPTTSLLISQLESTCNFAVVKTLTPYTRLILNPTHAYPLAPSP